MTIEKIMEVMNNNLQKSMNTTDQMINILKDSLKLIAISFVCNWCLFIPIFLCDGLGWYPIYTEYMELASYFICIVFEVFVFSKC